MIDISKVHKCKVWVGISLMLASYLWKLCFTLVLSPSLENEQRLSVGVLLTVLKSKIKLSTPAAFLINQTPNVVVGLNSNQFHEFWWIMICRHPQVKYEENTSEHSKKHTKDPIPRLTYKMGPFDRENWQTKPRHRHTQVGGPPGSVQNERRCERRRPGVGQTTGSVEPFLEPTSLIFGGKLDPIHSKAVNYVSIFIGGGNRRISTI